MPRTTGDTVLRRFIAEANAQYRAAGFGDQMRVRRDGSVANVAPRVGAAAAGRRRDQEAAQQAAAGAAAAGSTSAAPTTAQRSGAAPAITKRAPTADGFQLAWAPIPGATRYGVWQDGELLGHVPNPAFAGSLAAGGAHVIQVDAERADGTRSAISTPIRVGRTAQGQVGFEEPTAEQGAPTAAAAPTPAPGGAPTGSAPAAG